MQAGAMRHRIAIQTNTPTQDSYGEPVVSWGTVATVWAAVEMLSGRELFVAQQTESAATVRFRIRRRDVDAKQRVSWDGRTFGVESVIHDETNRRETLLLCKENQDA